MVNIGNTCKLIVLNQHDLTQTLYNPFVIKNPKNAYHIVISKRHQAQPEH
jgi:hypothetical protein